MLETMQRARDYPRSRVAVAYCASRGLRSSARKILVPPQSRNVGMVFQDLALWPHMSVWPTWMRREAELPGAQRDIV